MLGTHQGGVHREHIDADLEEFAFRFNRRASRSRGQLFLRLLENAVHVEPLPYERLARTIHERLRARTSLLSACCVEALG